MLVLDLPSSSCVPPVVLGVLHIYIYLFTAALAIEDIEEETEAWRGLHMVTFLTVHQSRTRQPFLSGLCIIITFRQTRGVRDLQAWKMPEARFDGIV